MVRLLIFIGFFLSTNFVFCQNLEFAHHVCAEDHEQNLEDLKKTYGKNKKYPESMALQIFLALSFYPELKETNIEFKKAILDCSLQARPKYFSLLRSRANRRYVILINEDEANPVHPSKSGFEAQVGFFSHELAHISDYETLTKGELLSTAWKYYFSPEFKKELEQKTDLIAIERGAGYLKYHASCFVFYESNASEEYIEKKKKFYFTPEQILEKTDAAASELGLK